jgi:hypothetical protein
MSAKNVQVAQFRSRANTSSEPALACATTHLGQIVDILGDDQVSVVIPGKMGTIAARLAVPVTRARLQEAINSRRGTVILIDSQASPCAIVLGLLEPIAPEAFPAAPTDRPEEKPQVVEADVDGKRVRIVGHDEIVLECGSASITLRRNGRVIIRGAYVETDSTGTNRIKGAAVRIN